MAHKGQPTVILAKTVKGFGLGKGGEGQMIAHQQKKLDDEDLQGVPRPLQHPGLGRGHRRAAVPQAGRGQRGDALPARSSAQRSAATCRRGAAPRRRSTCRRSRPSSRCWRAPASARSPPPWRSCACSTVLLKDKNIGKNIVPIVPDEARTFGMEGLFRQIGIYSSVGQLYTPQDADQLHVLPRGQEGPDARGGHQRGRARCARGSPPAPPTPTTASTWCRSTSTTRCSASSASATSSGPPATCRRAASCSARPPGARRWPARACSTRTATASWSRRPCPTASPTTRPTPTSSR